MSDGAPCPHCRRTATLVRGRCPECGTVSDPSHAPPASKVGGSAPVLPDTITVALTLAVLAVLVVLVVVGELVVVAIGALVLLLAALALLGSGLF